MTHSLRMSRCLEADTKPRDIESDRFASETFSAGAFFLFFSCFTCRVTQKTEPSNQ